nr:hypothetical protein [uncultured Rhodopila sp.]
MNSDFDPLAELRGAVQAAADALAAVADRLPAAPDPAPPGPGKSLTVKLDDAGIELAAGRPLFPVVLLRLMGSLMGEDTGWCTADEDDLENEPLLVLLWQVATEPDGDRSVYLNGPGMIVRAAALLAEATFKYLRDDGPMHDWWEAAGGGDAAITTALALGIREANKAAALARGIRESNKAAIIGHLVSGALVNYLQGETGEDMPIPMVETEALWRARAAAAGVI